MKTPTATQTQLIHAGIAVAQEWLAARAVESNTHYGAIGGAIAAQPLADHLTAAIAAGISHDYGNALANLCPVGLGLFGILAAIITPQNPHALNIDNFTATVSDLKSK